MDWIDVLQRIQVGEDAQTELGRFRSFGDKDWQEAVCAFANTEGGLVILGVTDDRAIDGVPMDPQEVQERLSNALHNTFNAPIQARLGYHQDPSGWVHWIEVARVRGPEPLRHKGRVLVRGNRGNREPSATELQELYNTFGLVFTEQRGSGYPRMTRAMRQFNGTAPHLEQDREERWVRVTLWRTPPEAVTPNDADAVPAKQ